MINRKLYIADIATDVPSDSHVTGVFSSKQTVTLPSLIIDRTMQVQYRVSVGVDDAGETKKRKGEQRRESLTKGTLKNRQNIFNSMLM